jgi:hypothetical protein
MTNPIDALHSNDHPLRRFIPRKAISQIHSRVFKAFATKAGLVYFGYVDQRDDEHSLIRGMTVSTKHRDNHYCIGSFEGYDVALVERVDTIQLLGKPAKTHSWVIMTFDLHTSIETPHVFVGSHAHSETFYAQLFTKFSHLAKVPFDESSAHSKEFTKKHTVYTKPDQILHTEQLFSPALTKVIGEQFGTLAIEVYERTVYIYVENHRPTTPLLESMLAKGIWLAKSIDIQEEHLLATK